MHSKCLDFFGLAYQGKDIVFRFLVEYSSLMLKLESYNFLKIIFVHGEIFES
jgi:hypothetical protein